MAQWSGSDSGILRKTAVRENYDDLLVFGYACKLFRDDEKALHIDQGKHLIPWMGNNSLKIDRYDCRGALSDLSLYEASREGYDVTRWLGLSEKERNLEELCDKERYYSLKINEEEEEMYKEEEEKRQKSNAIQYSYDVPQNPELSNEIGPTVMGAEEIDEEYVPPPILDVPVDIEMPKTVKENARIEKTALFVCTQGPQMEILIKAKQGANPQFSFLNQNDKLYKFYRHVLAAFKNGRYEGYEPKNPLKTDKLEERQDQESDSHYLHPSLLSANLQSDTTATSTTTVQIPQLAYKPSVNCAYSQLVNRIQGAQVESSQDALKQQAAAAAAPEQTQMTYEQQQQYYQYYYAQQYYEYYKQMAMHQQSEGGTAGQFNPPADFQNLDPNIQTYIQQIAYNHYLQQQQQLQQSQQQTNDNSYAQIVSNVNKDNIYSASVPQLPHMPQQDFAAVDIANPMQENGAKPVHDNEKAAVFVEKPLLSLAAAYGSASESDSEMSSVEDDGEPKRKEVEEKTEETKKEIFNVPSGETQVVIDKMAVYVGKNGEQFEDIIKAKGDPRFDFLKDSHEFNKYYRQKLKQAKEENKARMMEKKDEQRKEELKPKKEKKKVIAPVSFSIKKAKDDPPKEIKSALPVEESDEEEPESDPAVPPASTTPPSLVAVLTKYAEAQNGSREREGSRIVEKRESVTERRDVAGKRAEQNDSADRKNGLDVDDPLLEIIELTGDNGGEKRDYKRAEDKIKDKLAAAAREKLASISKDKALQLERKRKAAEFLRLRSALTAKRGGERARTGARARGSPVRRESIEIIDITSEVEGEKEASPKRRKKRSWSRDVSYRHKDRSEIKDRGVKGAKKGSRSRSRDRRRESEEYDGHRRKSGKKEKRRSHKRKRSKHSSKSKKKLKKHHKRSDSDSSSSSDSS